MKVFLTQLRGYSEDFEENFREVDRVLENVRRRLFVR